jgi:hypothetical protein
MAEVRRVTLGSTFKVTWINSGAVASPITFNIMSGSESLVSSYSGVDSGNGHYYADVAVRTPGLYQGRWFATISANTYINGEWYAAFPVDTDQPGRYITWDDVVHRFVGFGDVADALKAASHYLSYAEAYIDGRLGATFTIPFSNNNQTVRDLAIDVVYARSIRGSLNEEYKNLWAEVNSRIGALVGGTEVMVTNSGTIVAEEQSTPAWSSTEEYHPFFAATLPHIDMVPSSSHMQAEYDERGL